MTLRSVVAAQAVPEVSGKTVVTEVAGRPLPVAVPVQMPTRLTMAAAAAAAAAMRLSNRVPIGLS